MSINLGSNDSTMMPSPGKTTHYPEISVPREKVKSHKIGQTHHAKVKLHLTSSNEKENRYAVHSVDFGKTPAKSIDEAVDNASSESEQEKGEAQEKE